LDKPEVPPGSYFIIDAFWDLDTDRSHDGNIRWSVAREWFEFSGYDERVWSIFWDCVTEIDIGYRAARARATRNQ